MGSGVAVEAGKVALDVGVAVTIEVAVADGDGGGVLVIVREGVGEIVLVGEGEGVGVTVAVGVLALTGPASGVVTSMVFVTHDVPPPSVQSDPGRKAGVSNSCRGRLSRTPTTTNQQDYPEAEK